ncbi:NUDIX domain-containing protein [Spiroplasma endosymbiont of Danaus chrysippus]|uniref:NUDIX domain-containing protein n=1 Tax=Spiroplasma endosymbiont of Danaus chrysippus TaxID=2691041 RepID=UPI00157AC7DA|nr:NUDIX domain-containing protein [Spiroplasma endosymbiont of Danaus chrysippus]
MNKEYLKLIKVDFMNGIEEPWCNNQGVAILPYVLKNNEYHYLLTKEYNPLFKNKTISQYSTITGGLENNNHYQTVINEMFEETGIDIKNKKIKIHYLGKHYANKSSTKLWYFYGIDLSKLGLDLTVTYKGKSDNSVGEKEISARFVNEKQLNKSNDALSLATYGKLNLKNLIRFDNNINQKLDMILQILNDQKNNSNKSDENNWKD